MSIIGRATTMPAMIVFRPRRARSSGFATPDG
jgi:hypothetical protein